ncbi:MAG TPA: hypothetical protein VN428_19290 [Bryobacteraceae bacterium]|nr:hypothetical protein [Bryobacteraceae bacterium]
MRYLAALAFTSMMAVSLSGSAYGAEGQWQRGDRDDRRPPAYGQRRNADEAYRAGFERGRIDRQNNRRADYRGSDRNRGDSSYRDAYRDGYEAGYNDGRRGARDNGRYGRDPYYGDNGRRGNGSYGRDGSYGSYGNRQTNNQAYSLGLQDGRRDGQEDRMKGHSYRPTERGSYKDGDNGYNSAWGNKDAYKRQYRSGYLAGYQGAYGR